MPPILYNPAKDQTICIIGAEDIRQSNLECKKNYLFEISLNLPEIRIESRLQASVGLDVHIFKPNHIMIRSSGAKKRRGNGLHNPLGADIEADRMRGVRLKRPVKDGRDESDSDDEREVWAVPLTPMFVTLPCQETLRKVVNLVAID